MRNNRYILILSSLALVFGCTREHPEPIERLYGEPIPYSVSVDAGPLTRVAFDGSAINSGDYEFASGDQLYISDAEGNISGILDITSGVGSSTATFDGELIPVPNFTPTDDTDLTITLVGTSQTSFFTISGGRITGAPTYPSTIPASTPIADLVQNFHDQCKVRGPQLHAASADSFPEFSPGTYSNFNHRLAFQRGCKDQER